MPNNAISWTVRVVRGESVRDVTGFPTKLAAYEAAMAMRVEKTAIQRRDHVYIIIGR